LYKKELGYLDQWVDSTVVGKRNFLTCYKKAQQAAFTSQNIQSGWRATGMWPVSLTRPLSSPLLLENSTNALITVNPISDRAVGSKPIPQ
jgi:hypothetical protein